MAAPSVSGTHSPFVIVWIIGVSFLQVLFPSELVYIVNPGNLCRHFRRGGEDQAGAVVLLVVHFQVVPVEHKESRAVPASDIYRLVYPILHGIFQIRQLHRCGGIFRSGGIDRCRYPVAGVAVQGLAVTDRNLVVVIGTQLRVGILLVSQGDVHHQAHFLLHGTSIVPGMGIHVSRYGNFVRRPLKIAAGGLGGIPQLCRTVRTRHYRCGIGHIAQVVTYAFGIKSHVLAFVDGHHDFCRCPAQRDRQPRVIPLRAVVEDDRSSNRRFIVPFGIGYAVHEECSRDTFNVFPCQVNVLVLLRHRLQGVQVREVFKILFRVGAVGDQIHPIPLIFRKRRPFYGQCNPSRFIG